ncbi:hypothetical protein [Curtobacterium sp. VKM Ac-1376]|uniref:hypothetical protein n=1 Tax=Curtobacterium sp. VKM Ac-1376 TaxID=123312 RepID=UPI00188D3E0F|nr:hypothetical protein [Curtobacterium sp. VKM Ac-1376]MBF4615704.1 hypothetical protein [Curtobacterium sp. VKM Ac-1376]
MSVTSATRVSSEGLVELAVLDEDVEESLGVALEVALGVTELAALDEPLPAEALDSLVLQAVRPAGIRTAVIAAAVPRLLMFVFMGAMLWRPPGRSPAHGCDASKSSR